MNLDFFEMGKTYCYKRNDEILLVFTVWSTDNTDESVLGRIVSKKDGVIKYDTEEYDDCDDEYYCIGYNSDSHYSNNVDDLEIGDSVWIYLNGLELNTSDSIEEL